MRKLIYIIGKKVILLVALLLFANLNLSAQYKLELEWQKQPVGGSSIAALAVTNNDSIIYLSAGTSIYKVRTTDAEIIKSYPIELAYPWFLMSKDEKTIIVATGNAGENGMGLLDPETYKRTLWLNFPNFTGVTYNEKLNKMVVNYQPIIRIYDVATQKLDKEINTGLAITQVKLTDDGKYVVCGYYTYSTNPNKTHYYVKIIDLEGELIKDVGETSSTNFTFTVDGKTLIYFDNYAIHFFDLETMKEVEGIAFGGANPHHIEMSSDGKFMLVGAIYCDLATKKTIDLEKIDESEIVHFRLNFDNTSLFVGQARNLYKLKLIPTTSLIKDFNQNEFTIQENNNKLILTNPQNHQINTLTAYDILGRTYPLSANGNEVDVSGLGAGKYFLKVGLADGSFLDFSFVKE